MKRLDLSNQRFGKLIAIKIIGRHGSNNVWECVCDCGNITKTTATSLRLGNTSSCGCYRQDVINNKKEYFEGKKFGSLTIIKEVPKVNNRRRVYAICECGNEKEYRLSHLTDGATISCGCVGHRNNVKASTKHGLSYNKLYFVWYGMMTRCYSPSFPDYHNYGGRGISVCDEWFDIFKFISDVTEGYHVGLQLDRIDNNGNYCKQNCRWVTRKVNNRNKRTNTLMSFNGETKTLIEWSEIYGINYSCMTGRHKKGYSAFEVLFGKIKHEPSKMLPLLLK